MEQSDAADNEGDDWRCVHAELTKEMEKKNILNDAHRKENEEIKQCTYRNR